MLKASAFTPVLLATLLVARVAAADVHVLTPKAEPTLKATFSRVDAPCAASLESIGIDRSRITLHYERPHFEITLVHPDASKEGHLVGPYRVLGGATPACPDAPSLFAERLATQSPEDPWERVREPSADRPQWSPPFPPWARALGGVAVLLVHAALVILLAVTAFARKAADVRAWLVAPLAVSVLGWCARLATTPVVFNWYSITPESPSGIVLLGQGFVGLEELFQRMPFAGADVDHVFAFVRFSGALGCGLAVLVAERLGIRRRDAVLVGVLMALSPALVRMGASDAPHPVALTLWMAFCLAWERARTGGARVVVAWMLVGALLPWVRAETWIWLLAAVVLFPPRRDTSRAAWLALGVSCLSALLVALPSLRTAQELRGGSLLAWVSLPVNACSGLSRAPVVLACLVLAGLVVLARSDRSLAVRWGLAVLAIGAPVLASGHTDINALTLRYYLPLAFLVMVAVVVALSALGDVLAPRLAVAPLIAATLLCTAEARGWLATDRQYVFRHEVDFLRSTIARLPSDARVCMLDPAMNHDWPGTHVDFDSAWSPRGGAKYVGLEGRLVTVAGDMPDFGQCNHYYETAACFFEPKDARTGDDVDHVQRICAAWRAHVEPEPLAEVWASPVFQGTPFAVERVPLRLFRVRR